MTPAYMFRVIVIRKEGERRTLFTPFCASVYFLPYVHSSFVSTLCYTRGPWSVVVYINVSVTCLGVYRCADCTPPVLPLLL